MAYTSPDEVIEMFRDLKIGNDTAVKSDTLDRWIARQDAYIDSRLAEYYLTPITGDESLKIVGLIATYKVAHMVKTVLELTSENSDKNQDVQGNLDKKAEEMLDRLLPKKGKNGELLPPVMDLVDASKKPASPTTASTFSLQSQTPTFIKGGSNW